MYTLHILMRDSIGLKDGTKIVQPLLTAKCGQL
jgi:hypothetical protein